uniref:Cytochrome c oxidase subunit 8A, mitochondrial n=1 Tax=Stegastes partitus TaxID=144197 RepID=A0A3B4ZB72_9TELE
AVLTTVIPRMNALLCLALRTGVQQRATYIHYKPPKDKIGIMESAFVLTVMTLTVLGPSGWILSHVDEYKTRRP